MVTAMKYFLIALLLTAAGLGAIAAQQPQRPPLSKAEVLDMINHSLPSTFVIGAIRRYGIAFEPTDEILDEFCKAGANGAVVEALEEAAPPELKRPLSDKDLLALVGEGAPSESIVRSVKRRGIDFQPSEDRLAKIRSQGAKDALIDALRATPPRPFSKDELAQSLAARQDPGQIAQKVRERGIDFEPNEENLAPLRTAGASEALLQAVRGAKRTAPFVPQLWELAPPNPNATSTAWEGKEATLICSPSDLRIPVMAGPDDLGKIVAVLQCGERVTFLEKDSVHVGIDKVRYAEGKVGYVADHYFSGMTYPGRDPLRATGSPIPTYRPEPSYTPEARHAKNQGTLTLSIVVDPQGNVTDVQEVSKRLGDGLDEKAIETVKTWKFLPAMRGGVPVPVRVMVEISFRLKYGTP
jgi:TonB family protein